ncbi:hypothetical protein [Mycobacteroides abscessus]|uniref:hypothetical protein n=1 Tax=Mycobacteroides abscessus TaxID=36809 RepID=UPI002105AF5C|nr:hypothetical protein [Mycobacteroides abscessus]
MRRGSGRPLPGWVRRGARAVLSAPLIVVTAAALTAAPVRADDAVVHRVTYTVTSEHPTDIDVYYRDVDPPSWADYSHNPYHFTPKDEVALSSGKAWVREVALVDPAQWAMVAVARTSIRSEGVIRCELAVDGTVVHAAEGPAGAVCSLRHW